MRDAKSKIKGREELKGIVTLLQKQGKRVVFTNGCFDLLHIGHVRYLEDAKREGDILIVGVNSDSSTRRLKGRGRPVIPEDERAEIVASLEAVDYVTIFDEADPLNLIRELLPDLLVKGGDYRIEEVIGRDVVEGKGGKVKILRKVECASTTDLIEQIRRSGRW